MGAWEIIVGILVLLFAVAIIAIVLLQQSRSAGLSGTIAGGADTFLSKGKAKSVDVKLASFTKYAAIIFVVLILAANAIMIFVK